MRPLRSSPRRRTRGFTMIEVLVSLLVASFGLMALVGLQATAVRLSTDARDRGAATFLADQLLGQLLIADHSTTAKVNGFAHNPDGAACSPDAAPSSDPVVTAWLAEVLRQLPNAPLSAQQVIVRNAAPQVDIEIVLCWKRGNDPNEPRHSLVVNNRVQW
jgi:type IV pilus assembly protein PilV